jgi:hypothetical protein
MSKFNKGGLIGGFDQLRAPNAPTAVAVDSEGNAQVDISFTSPQNIGSGTISNFHVTALAANETIGGSGTSSPVTVSGLTNDTTYTFSVIAESEFGSSPSSETVTGTPTLASPYALHAIGNSSGYNSTVERITVASTGNATDFGDLSGSRGFFSGGVGDTTRFVVAGGVSITDTMEYFTYASTGNATDFGNLSADSKQGSNGQIGNLTRGVIHLGANSSNTALNTLEHITIQTTGNSTDFGDLTVARRQGASSGNSTRGIFFPGQNTNVIDYITIASAGNATDFGDAEHATDNQQSAGGVASSTRAVFMEGDQSNARFVYVTIASTGNATDFGVPNFGSGENKARGSSGASNTTRGVFFGGENITSNRIQYITIASTGNATDFGDLNYNSGVYAYYGISGSGGATGAIGS